MHGRILGIVTAALLYAPAVLLSQPQARPALPSGTNAITGVVIDAQSGASIAGALVTLVETTQRGRGQATSSEDGTFAFAKLGDGAYGLSAKTDGYSAGAFGAALPLMPGETIALAGGQTLRSIDVRLHRGGVIKGRVLDESGEPLPGSVVVAGTITTASPTGFLGAVAPVRSDRHGAYDLRDIPPGAWIVSATGTPFAIDPEAPEGPTEYDRTFFPGVIKAESAQLVKLEPGGTIEGVTFALQRSPLYTLRLPVDLTGVEPSTVEIVVMSDKGLKSQQLTSQAIASDGHLVVHRLKPGDYLLWIRGKTSDGQVAGAREISIAADTEETPVTLSPAATIAGRIVAEAGEIQPPPGLRVTAHLIMSSGFSPLMPADASDVTPDGRFTVPNLFGNRRLRVEGLPAPWTVRRLLAGGREVPQKTLFGLRSGQILDATFVVGRE
jgi:hypothetical protein